MYFIYPILQYCKKENILLTTYLIELSHLGNLRIMMLLGYRISELMYCDGSRISYFYIKAFSKFQAVFFHFARGAAAIKFLINN